MDQGYDYDKVHDLLCEFGLTAPIRKHGEAVKERREDASRKAHRWVVERTLRGRNMFNRILVICVGNICRSPMAEALLGRQLSAYPQMSVTSAGIGALVGYPADETAQALLLKQGIDISTHRARQLNSAMLRQADLVLVMEAEHKRAIDMIDPSVRGKIYRLGEWGGFDISDPYRQPREAFEECLRLIQRGVADWSAKLIL